MDTKTCTKCGETKALTEFYVNKGCVGGVSSQCKACHRIASKQRYLANPEKVIARARVWAEANPEKRKTICAKSAKKRAPEIAEYTKKWRKENPNKAYRVLHPDKYRACQREWKKNNPEKQRAQKQRAQALLTPAYVANALHLPVGQLTPELLELKRQQLELHRLQRQLQATLKDLNHDERREPERTDRSDLPDLCNLDHG